MKDLKQIVDDVKSLKSEDFKPSDDAILNCATNILLGGKEEKPKKSYPNKSFNIKDPQAPATDKQKHRLDELEIKYPEELTKGEAHGLISEHGN